MHRPLLCAMLIACLGATTAGAQAAPAARDTMPLPDNQLFHRSDLWVAGAFVAGTVAMLPFDQRMTSSFRDEYRRENSTLRSLADAGTWIGGPGVMIMGSSMFAIGKLGGVPRLAEMALHGTEAVLVGQVFAAVLKGTVGRARPYATADTNSRSFGFGRGFGDGRYKAFPSGHATSAFAAAAAVVTETREWWPGSTVWVAPVMYGGATMVGLSRIYNDQHWASDIMMGAAIGTFAGLKTVRFNHTRTGNTIDRVLLGTRVVPTENGPAVGYSMTF